MKSTKFKDIRKKLVIIGDGCCGKTSLLHAYAKNEFINEHHPTIVDTHVQIIQLENDKKVELVIYDTAGQEEYDKLRPIFYKDTNVILLCYSIDLPNSLTNIPDKWMPEIRFFCPQIPLILVGVKKDLRNDPITCRRLKLNQQRPVKLEDGQSMAKRVRANYFFECSCKTFENINEIFYTAAKLSLNEALSNMSVSSNNINMSKTKSINKKNKKNKNQNKVKNCTIL